MFVEDSSLYALETADFLRPNMVLIDYQRPDMNGIRLLERLRERCGPLPARMVSAYSNRRQASLEAGFGGFLLKPFDVNELITEVQLTLALG